MSEAGFKGMFLVSKREITSFCKSVKKREPLYTIGRDVNWYTTVENDHMYTLKITLHNLNIYNFYLLIIPQ